MTEAGGYADYLERVRLQEARDRDRFLGHDSHEDRPTFDARTGALAIPPSLDQLNDIMQVFTEWAEQTVESLRPYLEQFADYYLEGDQSAASPVGILTVRPERHTYPRQHGEWWTNVGAQR